MTCTLPIIMVSARSEDADRIRGLVVGADDHVVKFSTIELIARVNALLRRSRMERGGGGIRVGSLSGSVESARSAGDHAMHLGPTEFQLLQYLLEKPGRVFSRLQLMSLLWGQLAEIQERTVDVHVGRLRKKLSKGRERDPAELSVPLATLSTIARSDRVGTTKFLLEICLSAVNSV